jgi:hypothetical protein
MKCSVCGKEIEYDEGNYDGEVYTCFQCIEDNANITEEDLKNE